MFDIGWTELLVIGVVALVVIGPKDLPKALSTMGKWMARARAMAREFQNNVDDMVRQAELDELREQVQKARNFNLTDELEKSIDPDGGVRKSLALEDFTSPAEPKPGDKTPVRTVDSDGEDIADMAIAAPAPPHAPTPVPAGPTSTGTVAADPVAAAASVTRPLEPTEPTKDTTR